MTDTTNNDEAEYAASDGDIAYVAWLNACDDLREQMRKTEPIHQELNSAMGAYMAALDDPKGKSEALTRFDAGLVRLREVFREEGWDWERWAAQPHMFKSDFL